MKQLILYIMILLLFLSCESIQATKDKIFKTPARKIYSRSLNKDDIEVLKWETEYDVSKHSPLVLDDAYASILIRQDDPISYGYELKLNQGEELFVEINTIQDSQYFIEFYQVKGDELSKKYFSSAYGEHSFRKEIQESGRFKVIIQPALDVFNNAEFKIYSKPTIGFPVANANNQSIKSFWGAPRDGGARKHEGVDIFAPKGTSLLSAVKGTVYRVGNQGLGGKQVWVKDNKGYAYYYAHLDNIIATKGKKVEVGDILGTVGNTGNAKTTPPHLHFGIYEGGNAVDPYPFIKLRDEIPKVVKKDIAGKVITNSTANLRKGPSLHSEVLKSMNSGEILTVTSQSTNWFEVRTKDNELGFVYHNLVQ